MDTTTENSVNINYQDVMLKFNSDPDFIKLRDRYATKSFLEIMATDRSENRHSSFLAWLLEGKDFPVKDQDHPIVHLLDILIRRSQEQSSSQEQSRWPEEANNIKTIILSRNIKSIHIDEISTEKTISQVSEIPSVDRLDIYIEATIVPKNGDKEKIEFFIENKVGSKENGKKTNNETNDYSNWEKYCGKPQTERYYFACHDKPKYADTNKIQFFIYLTPISNVYLDKFEFLKEDQKSKSKNFININYQDILDNIIEPLLDSNNLPNRIQILLEEYVLSLSLPALIDTKQSIKGSLIMATRKSEIENIKNLLGKEGYKDLIKESLYTFLQGDADANDLSLLLSFGTTYEKLLTAILRVWIESMVQDSENKDDLMELYKKLLSNPRDNTKFSIDDGTKMGKCAFAVKMLKWLLEYEIKKNSPEEGKEFDWCFQIQSRYWQKNPKKRLWVVLHKSWYAEHNSEKLLLNDDAPEDKKLKKDVEKKRYEPFGNYWVSNQWGLDHANENSNFDLLLKKICGESLTAIKKGNKNKDITYSVSNLQNGWNDVLENKVSKITIHLQ